VYTFEIVIIVITTNELITRVKVNHESCPGAGDGSIEIIQIREVPDKPSALGERPNWINY